MRKRFWKGLRTIDLVIGLAIICMILAVVTIRFDEFKCRSMQSEAKFSLHEVYAAQKLFFAEHEHYATLEQLMNTDGRIVVPQKNYILIETIRPTDRTFSVLAKGAAGTLVAGEIWSIDETNELRLQNAVCKN